MEGLSDACYVRGAAGAFPESLASSGTPEARQGPVLFAFPELHVGTHGATCGQSVRRGLFWDVAGQGHIAWIRTLAPTRAVGPWGDDVSPPSFWAFRFLTTKRVTWQLSTALTSRPVPSPPHFSNHSEQSEAWGVCLEQPPSLPPTRAPPTLPGRPV